MPGQNLFILCRKLPLKTSLKLSLGRHSLTAEKLNLPQCCFTTSVQRKNSLFINNTLLKTALVSSLTFLPLHLAHAADAGSLLLEQQQTLPQLALPIQEEAESSQPANIKEDATEDASQTIVIQKILFTGKKAFLSEAFQTQLFKRVKGKKLGIQGIVQLRNEITAHLQQQGHLLASATLPAQDLTEGALTIDIMDGHLSNIQFDYIQESYSPILKALFADAEQEVPIRVKEGTLKSIVNDNVSTNAVTKSDLEEALLRINDHPGVSAKSRLAQGKEANSSDLIIDVRQQPILAASASIDNFGSYSTGQELVRAQTSLTDITGYGDVTQLSLVASEGQTFASGAFSLPVPSSKATAKVSYSYLDYQNIDDTFSSLELEGYAHFATVGLDYRLIRSRTFNLNLNGRLNGKMLADDSILGLLQDKESLSSTLGITGDRQDAFMGGGALYWSADWTYGYLDLSGVTSALETDQESLQTNGQFHHVNLSLARIQNLPNAFSLFGRVYGQWANKNLDSSEGFILGGPTGLRGWPVGEASGDMGALGVVELRYDLPISPSLGKVQLATFIDSGHIWINQDATGVNNTNACDCNDYSLTSVGIAARWDTPYLTLLASYAQGVGDNPGRTESTDLNADNTDDNYQIWLTATARF